MVPAPGRKSCSGSSALIRNSIAWPRWDDVLLREPEGLARRDPHLGGHEVDAGQHLGHRVLDLDPAVDLDEVGVAVVVDEELERADVLVAGRDDGTDRALGERLAPGRGHRRRRRLLEDLLVPALDRAVALPQVDAVAEPVDRDLDLDVPVVLQPALEVQRVVAERGAGLGAADRQHGGQLARRADHPHALAAAARRRLDEHRVADPLRLLEGVGLVAEQARARDRRQAVIGEQPAGLLLRGEPLEDVGGRADEREPVGTHGVGERVVLGQEPVARVDRRRSRSRARRRSARAPRGTSGAASAGPMQMASSASIAGSERRSASE